MFKKVLCAGAMLFAVDGWAMDFLNDGTRKDDYSHLTGSPLQLNEKLRKPAKKLTDVQKCEFELKYVVYVASILEQKNSPQIENVAKKLSVARIKEAEALRQAEKERLEQKNREMINGLISKMSPVYKEIYRKSLTTVLSSNRENIFMTHYENDHKKNKDRSELIDITAINNSLEKLGINVTV